MAPPRPHLVINLRAEKRCEDTHRAIDNQPMPTPTDQARVEAPPQPKKDEEFWFDDGNIVVVAEDTAFKLYKGVLSRVSPVFEDLFSLPQPPEDAKTMDGCPVVPLYDSAEELRHFFRLVAKPQAAFSLLRHDSRPSFRMLAAICRIGHKYQSAEAVDAASERIVLFFEKACSEGRLLNAGWDDFWESHQRNIGITVELTDAIEAINLARLLDKPSILPFAFYLCCAAHPLHLRNGVRREDGTLQTLSDDDYLKCAWATPQLLARCVHDVRRLLAYYRNGHGRASCQAAQRCQEVFRQMDAEMEGEAYLGELLDLFVVVGCRKVQPQAYLSRCGQLCQPCLYEMAHCSGTQFFPEPSILKTFFSS